MGIFSKKSVESAAGGGMSSELLEALSTGSYDDFERVYTPDAVNAQTGWNTTLTSAMGNDDVATRVKIANRLLDDGADVHQGHPLHALISTPDTHDFDVELSLVKRLVEAGVSVNDRTDDGSTPLEELAETFRFSMDTITPLVDYLLSQPDLDLLGPGGDDRPVLTNLRKLRQRRAGLVEMVEASLTARGVEVPPEG